MASQPERIQRSFLDIPDKAGVAEEMVEVDLALGRRGMGWETLLKSKRILIFSQAGVGKTFECQAEQKRLWDDGEPAYFLELAQLAKRNFRDMLSPEEEARFEAWSASSGQQATFFLDSYDELLLTLGSFRQALTTLAKVLSGGKLARARIVVTSRPVPLDEQLFRQLLPIPAEKVAIASEHAFADIAMAGPLGSTKDDDDLWRRVVLAPLNTEQIRQMAALQKVANSDALLADIRRRNAESFARRPQDLIDLCTDWNNARRIQTHRQQLDADVELKLKPRSDSREKAALSFDKALEGARRLALGCLLTRKLTLRHSTLNEAEDMDEAALDPGAILTDWSAKEIETLLERPLFGFASYGRVRFHHRSVVEYLAAEQLLTLLISGMTRRGLNRLVLAQTTQGARVVKPSMRPVAAWLAASDDAMFDDVLEREPELLLNSGDPSTLTPAQRGRALEAYVTRYGPGGWRGMTIPSIQIHRFATAELGLLILDVWRRGVENEEVREVLLNIVAAGKIKACADIAFEATMTRRSAYGERADAIEALIALEDRRLQEAVTALVANTDDEWGDRISRWSLLRLFPGHMSIEEGLALMGRLTESRKEVTGISWQLPQIIAQATFSRRDLETLRAGLTDLVSESITTTNIGPGLTSARQFLVSSLAAVCVRLIALEDENGETLRASALALRLVDREYGEEKPSESLRRILAGGRPSLRERMFVAGDALSQSLEARDDAWNRFYEAAFHGPTRPDAARDSSWVLARLGNPTEAIDLRAVFLEYAFELARSESDPRTAIGALRPLVADDPQLLERISERLRPARRNRRWAAWEAKAAKREQQSKRKDLRHRASWIAFWREVSQHPEKVFADDRVDNTAWNLWHAMARSGQEGRGSGWKREFLERFFGTESADRLRLALMRFWRSERPTLISERDPDQRNTFMTSWQLGSAGVAAEAEDPHWARDLSIEEAALALRYVSVELGGFPSDRKSVV